MVGFNDKDRRVKMIRLQYEQLSEKWGYDVQDLLGRFEQRFKTAKANKENLSLFFKAENQAISIFEKKLEVELAEEAEDETDDEGDESSSDSGRDYEQDHLRISIHKDASKDIEHLLGAMKNFYDRSILAIKESRKLIRDKIYRGMSYEVETLLLELGNYHETRLPVIFEIYLSKIEKANARAEYERAKLDVFRAVVNLVRKVKLLERWLRNHKTKYATFMQIPYGGEDYSTEEVAGLLAADLKKIVNDFGLRDFLDS